LLYAFFWVIPRRLNFICRRFEILCLLHLHRLIAVNVHLSAHEDGTECSETSAYKIQTPWNYPEESTQHSKHGKSLKSRIFSNCYKLRKRKLWHNIDKGLNNFTDDTNSRCSLEISHLLAMTQFLYHVAQKMFRAMLMLLKCSIKGKLSVYLLKRPTNVFQLTNVILLHSDQWHVSATHVCRLQGGS
jgi:hypothetical protein